MEKTKLIKETAEELLKNLKIEGKVEVKEKEEVYEVQIETPDTEVLIGYHGEALASFQLILSLIIYKQSFSSNKQSFSSNKQSPVPDGTGQSFSSNKKLGSWSRLIVNVGDWRQRQEEALRQMALGAAERVIATGEPAILSYLSSFERRIVHLALADHPKVATASEGEGEARKLIIKPREAE